MAGLESQEHVFKMAETPLPEDSLQTTCPQCKSVFKINNAQLLAADGQVECGQCHYVFDANTFLVNTQEVSSSDTQDLDENVSLHQAMNEGLEGTQSKNFAPLFWMLGILSLAAIFLLQYVYFDRYNMIQKRDQQRFVIELCKYIPCSDRLYKSPAQFSLLERNIFTHPNKQNALLISGSFVNEAPFVQPAPLLKISLFNLQGEVIAQRIFNASEYRHNKTKQSIVPGETIHFKLEIEDPKTVTITYEFEFL